MPHIPGEFCIRRRRASPAQAANLLARTDAPVISACASSMNGGLFEQMNQPTATRFVWGLDASTGIYFRLRRRRTARPVPKLVFRFIFREVRKKAMYPACGAARLFHLSAQETRRRRHRIMPAVPARCFTSAHSSACTKYAEGLLAIWLAGHSRMKKGNITGGPTYATWNAPACCRASSPAARAPLASGHHLRSSLRRAEPRPSSMSRHHHGYRAGPSSASSRSAIKRIARSVK